MNFLRKFGMLLLMFLPWIVRRPLLCGLFGYQIHPSARIKLSWVFPKQLVMEENSRIGPFTVAIHLDRIELGSHSSIGRRNWITGFPTGGSSKHFKHQTDRKSELLIGCHSAVTKNHHLDCTSTLQIGDYSTIAGYFSQFLTHSIDLQENRQSSAPITIGSYCFVGTNAVILGGARLPDYSVMGAKSLLNKSFEESFQLYAGIPAKPAKALPREWKYFHRTTGFVE